MQSNLCPLAFHGIYVERFADGKYVVSPCCLANKSDRQEGPIDFANNTHLVKIRQELLKGNRPDACKSCWELENHGGVSRRIVYSDKLKHKELYKSVDIYNLDYNTLPICNAKCVICGPRFSSTWAKFHGSTEINEIVKNNYNHLDGLDLDQVEMIYFNGGEPLLTEEHTRVLKKIKNLDNTDLMYNTNGSVYPADKILDLWSRARSIILYFSIDGINERFEETRFPLKWKQVSDVVERINLIDYIEIGCSYTIGRHNVYDLEDTIEWFDKLPNFITENQFHVHYADGEFSLRNSSYSEKENWINELSKFKNYYWYKSLVDYIKDEK